MRSRTAPAVGMVEHRRALGRRDAAKELSQLGTLEEEVRKAYVGRWNAYQPQQSRHALPADFTALDGGRQILLESFKR